MLIDMHAHLWLSHPETDKRDILRMCEAFSLDKVYVSSLGGFYPDAEEIHTLNRLTADFMGEQPGLIEGYCYLNPRNPNALDELRRCIESEGMSGVKLWVATFCDDSMVNPIAEQCTRYDIPMLVHAFHKAVEQLEFESLGENVGNLARRYPELKIIMAHLGANCYRELPPIKDCPNVWADFSGSLYQADDLAYAKKLLGADRLLFGTDMPGVSFRTSWGKFMEADFTPEEWEKVAWKNTVRLFERKCANAKANANTVAEN